jgi:hypothetical protein
MNSNNPFNSKILKKRHTKSLRLLGCCSMSLGKQFPTLRTIVVPSSSRSRSRMLNPEGEGSTIFRNMGNCLPNDTESSVAEDFIIKHHRSQNLKSRKIRTILFSRHFPSSLLSVSHFRSKNGLNPNINYSTLQQDRKRNISYFNEY